MHENTTKKGMIFQNLIKCTVPTVQVNVLTVPNSTLLKNSTFLMYWQYKQNKQYMLPTIPFCVSWLYGTAPLIPTNWYLGTKQSSILQTPYLLHQVLIENIFLPPGICDSSHYARYHIPPSHPGHSFKRYWPPSQLIG